LDTCVIGVTNYSPPENPNSPIIVILIIATNTLSKAVGVCIEFGPIYLQFRFYNSKKLIWGLTRNPPPKYGHVSI